MHKENETKQHNNKMCLLPSHEEEMLIIKRINSSASCFGSMNDVQSFLDGKELSKCVEKRLLAYAHVLKIFRRFSGIGEQVVSIIKEYATYVIAKFGDTNDPLTFIENNESHVIAADIPRSLPHFVDACIELHIKENDYESMSINVKRILAVISLSDKRLSYTQGFDRWVFHSYALALSFMQAFGFRMEFAESMAFAIARRLISIASINELLEDPEQYYPFKMLDVKLYKVRKDISDELATIYEPDFGCPCFALSWRLLWFADEYKPTEVFLIWDHFLLHVCSIDRYFFCQALAHIKQINSYGDYSLIEALQNPSSLDVIKAINDADLFFSDESMYIESEEDEQERQRRIAIFNRARNNELCRYNSSNDKNTSKSNEIGKAFVNGFSVFCKATAGATIAVSKKTVELFKKKETSELPVSLKNYTESFAKNAPQLFNPFTDGILDP